MVLVPAVLGPKIKAISERKTGGRWFRAWAWCRSTQIRGSGAVITPELRSVVPGRKSGKGGPATQGWHAFPAPRVSLGHQVWLGKGKGPTSELPSWLSDTGPVQRQQMQHSETDITKQSARLFPLGLDSASEPLSE